ncbi:MAG: B12-binding domain-containing radical SAM protein [Desulfobacteraceae bacterium]|nr:B12-binding domain-containing radical SAM protein [Desulfobacteraceae bacterium]
MKALLIYPEYPVTFWSFKHVLKIVTKKAAYPPLGLLTIAAMLPQEWDIRLIDLNIEKLKDSDIEWADYVFISAMLVQKKSVSEILDRCSQFDTKVVAGGPLFNSAREDYVDLVDHLILNEAELSLPPFLADLEKGTPKKIYQSGEFPDLSLTPIPRWDLIKVKKYATLMIQFSRGCPFNCEFCDITAMYGHKPRLKSANQLISELEYIYAMGWRGNLFIVDDNFIGNKNKIKMILPRLIDWMKAHKYPFIFLTEASINLADDDELIKLMVDAGFDTVFIGLETPDDKSLKECSKFQNRGRDQVAAIKKLQAAGFQVLGGYIVGFDNDDETIFSRQIKFIQESGVVTAMVGMLNALPNTRLWSRLKTENRLLLNIPGHKNDGTTINFIPRMDKEKLIEGYRKMVRTIYSPRYFYKRVCMFLENYQPQRKQHINRYQVKAFIKSVFYLGMLGNGVSQWYYWKMFLKSMIYYRNVFPEAMTLMVYGYHFRKVAYKV